MKGTGYGAFPDIILGIIGAFIGGIVVSGIQGEASFLGSIVIAFVCAVILVWAVRAIGV